MDPKLITPLLIGALVIFSVYRRMRRTFGRQTVSEGSMWTRIVILTVVGALFAYGAVRSLTTLEALLGGVVGGAVLGYLGLKHTQFEVTAEGRFYTPHTYIGLIVTALFVGRIVYRLLIVYPTIASPAAQAVAPNGNLGTAYQNSPMTAATFGLLIAYYVLYYLGVMQKTRTLSQGGPAQGPA